MLEQKPTNIQASVIDAIASGEYGKAKSLLDTSKDLTLDLALQLSVACSLHFYPFLPNSYQPFPFKLFATKFGELFPHLSFIQWETLFKTVGTSWPKEDQAKISNPKDILEKVQKRTTKLLKDLLNSFGYSHSPPNAPRCFVKSVEGVKRLTKLITATQGHPLAINALESLVETVLQAHPSIVNWFFTYLQDHQQQHLLSLIANLLVAREGDFPPLSVEAIRGIADACSESPEKAKAFLYKLTQTGNNRENAFTVMKEHKNPNNTSRVSDNPFVFCLEKDTKFVSLVFEKQGGFLGYFNKRAVCDSFSQADWEKVQTTIIQEATLGRGHSDAIEAIIRNGYLSKLQLARTNLVQIAVNTRSQTVANYVLTTGWGDHPGNHLTIDEAIQLSKFFPQLKIFRYSTATSQWDISQLVELAVTNGSEVAARFALEKGWIRHYPGDDLKPKHAIELLKVIPRDVGKIFKAVNSNQWTVKELATFATKGYCQEAADRALQMAFDDSKAEHFHSVIEILKAFPNMQRQVLFYLERKHYLRSMQEGSKGDALYDFIEKIREIPEAYFQQVLISLKERSWCTSEELVYAQARLCIHQIKQARCDIVWEHQAIDFTDVHNQGYLEQKIRERESYTILKM